MAQEEGGEVERRSEEKTNKQLFLRLLNFISNDDKKTLAIACIAMSLTSVNNLAFPKIISNLIDSMSNSSNTQAKRKLVVSSLIMFAVGAVGSWLRTYLFTIASDSVSKRLRVELFKAILKQESGFFDQTPVQDMQCRMTDDVQAMANATTSNFAKVYRYTNSALGGSIMLFSISPRLTVATLGVVPLVGVTGMLYGMRAKKMSKKMKENISRIASSVDEKLANIRTVRLFSMEDYEGEEYANLLNSTQEDVKHAAHAEGLFLGGLAFGGFTSLLGVLYYGGTLVERNLITVGALTSFAMYSATVGLGFSGLSQVYAETLKALSSAQRVFEILDRKPSVNQDDGRVLDSIEGNIEVCNVCFAYPSRPDALVLSGVTIQLHKGETLALTGPSGGGKSTIAALITRLYEPSSGKILLDGINMSTLSASWIRKQIAVVNQDPILFSDTIEANIAYGRPHAKRSISEFATVDIQDAARRANALSFIVDLPDGFQTQVGERGSLLSGGQRQRIAIARAMIRDPKILILDEATSALDNASEQLVKEALERLMEGRSTLLIAHRTSTLAGSQRIAVIDGGRIVEEGHYDDLISKRDSIFSHLIQSLPC
ncbi:hypothetical protein GUITHDRAFT_78381 [Guillardia theta CCMP2712]|uniref:ABC transporter n=1 Tax=Guillardia theta (strain CCMP2712) TaxID=905079 RepID=L1IMG7_GUITC|nr:hypothetical protein GUITHDRAFT_78381 [Guillardia theta CCMP2712]EKX37099.1 hypothetical protein GUITHDRAFT_78381 [Guillardia theta CCMP2712]|mmetsp:Transcript_49566/g.155274  ORF Transcript_49566/g.155274 Transcript_49566/m.155274 type:complete len:601 (-) Transcript_49566:30-1832(-)|eukprot:XP_005824079.1 hypothetical protein GUITHDRAFT_78381 [Guillardia theta CCMP2712]